MSNQSLRQKLKLVRVREHVPDPVQLHLTARPTVVRNVGTADDQVAFLLEQGLKLKTDGSCWCIVTVARSSPTGRHSVKRCACACHVRPRR